jgi:molybdenum cofactor biosynthesis enzyme MoaA
MRIALCKECNFDCFFCHSEGLDRTGGDSRQPVETILSLIDRATEIGFSDITFTGGEPLLRHKDLVRILDRIGSGNGMVPDMTVVSNASHVPPSVLDSARNYAGNIKFNVSLHSIHPERFREIVRVETAIGTVLENIRRIAAAGIRVKLNSVVLNGLNSGSRNLQAFLATARDLGAGGVKLLELLITPANHNHYNYFYSDEAIRRDLEELGFTEQESTLRTRLYASPAYPDLPVEITRCTCKLGCTNCSEHRDRQFDSLLRIHPCFVLSQKSFDPGEDRESLVAALEQVDSSIDRYAALYGNDSPVLVPHEVYVENKSEIFFTSTKTPDECDAIMNRLGYKARKKRSFHLIFCLPESADSEWEECRKVMKYGFDTHTPNKFEIIFSRDEYSVMNGHLVCTSSYMSEKPEEIPANDILQARQYIEAFGYHTWFEKSFHINDYMRHENGPAISIDHSTTPINLKMDVDTLKSEDASRLLEELDAEPVTMPFPQWLYRHRELKLPAAP